jgi:hypothetical protein
MNTGINMATILDNPPISGQYEEVIFDINDPWRGQTWNYVLFTTSSGDEWVGHFRSHDGVGFKMTDLPSKGIVCIVSGGHGYIVDIDTKMRVADLKTEMILDLASDDATCSFYISTYWGLSRIDENLNEIDIYLPVATDGIYFTHKIDRKLFLRLEEVGVELDTKYDYYIDLGKPI